jgi:hypothetical protein
MSQENVELLRPLRSYEESGVASCSDSSGIQKLFRLVPGHRALIPRTLRVPSEIHRGHAFPAFPGTLAA